MITEDKNSVVLLHKDGGVGKPVGAHFNSIVGRPL